MLGKMPQCCFISTIGSVHPEQERSALQRSRRIHLAPKTNLIQTIQFRRNQQKVGMSEVTQRGLPAASLLELAVAFRAGILER